MPITATNADGTDSNTLTITVYSLQDSPFNRALDNDTLLFTGGGDADWFLQTNVTHDGEDALQSGSISDNQETYVQTSISGPALLQFWWSTSSEEGYDLVELSVDGNPKRVLSGDKGWEVVTYPIPSGSHVVRWTYIKDTSESGHDDTVYLDQVSVTPGTPPSLGEVLDHTAHTWVDAGDAAWFGQTVEAFDSVDCAASGGIGDDQATAFQTTVAGPGQLSFYWKVSSEEDYDYLSFSIDGATQAQISGEVDWEKRTFSVTAGASRVLAWRYEKDVFTSENRDAAWVDRVVYVPDGTAAGYSTWAAQVFTPAQQADEAVSGPGANPDQDPYDNLTEYALDMDALADTATNAPIMLVTGDTFVYRYRHDSSKTTLTYSLERARMLHPPSWLAVTTSVIETEGPVELREHRHAVTNWNYIRLKVTETVP